MTDLDVLVTRTRVAAGTAWEVGEGGNKTPSQEPEVRNILRDCANAIERLSQDLEAVKLASKAFAETIDGVREALGQEKTHYLVVADDVQELVQAIEACASDGGCRAKVVLERLRER
jgi:glycosyltransferase involved in cell wall biosynthesis